MHEAKQYEDNVSVTLTYDDKHVPSNGSLRPADFVEFMKRLRWHMGKVRFFQCGEYGDELGRPHHHALLFGMDFPDRRYYRLSESGSKLYTSGKLDAIWGQGQCTLGAVTFESAAYVARYVMKKITGPPAASHYGGKIAEYVTMSRRPGIGRLYIERNRSDVYPRDEVVVRGFPCRPPRYYDQVEEVSAPSVMARVKARRRVEGVRRAYKDRRDNGSFSLVVKEGVKVAQVAMLKRGLEES